MKNKIKQGSTLTFIATAVVLGGAGVLLGDEGLFGVNAYDVAIGESGEAEVEGVFELPMAAVTTGQFDVAYWDDDNKVVTNVATDNTKIGHFANTPTSGGTGQVRLQPA